MENKFFRPAGNLTDETNTESKFFRPVGDLREEKSDLIYPKKADENLTPFRNPGDIESGYFKSAGDLSSSLESGNSHFKPAGDLSEEKSNLIYPKTDTPDLTPFRTPEEIVDYFRPAENLNDINNEITKKINNNEEKINKLNNNINKINDYLLTVVSGKKYDNVCELGVLMGAGRMIVGLEQLMKMVDEGYNIVSATVINADRNMIEIEFQRYEYDKEKMERWRRF